MAQERRIVGDVLRQTLPPENVTSMETKTPTGHFGGELARLALENVYEPLWTRPGLRLKERRLLTIGTLIGLGKDKALRSHFAACLPNVQLA